MARKHAVTLASQIRDLSGRIEADLVAAHDYYEHTKVAWRLVRQFADEGRTADIQNLQTGTVMSYSDLAIRSRGYVAQDLAESVFERIVSLLEDWVFGLLRLWLLAHPKGIPSVEEDDTKQKKMVPFADILAAADKDAIIQGVVDKILHNLAYKRLSDEFKYLEGRVKLNSPTADQVARLAEIKVTRDVLVHNRGIVNPTYVEKAGAHAIYNVGQRIEIREPYLNMSWELVRAVVREMAAKAIVKSTP